MPISGDWPRKGPERCLQGSRAGWICRSDDTPFFLCLSKWSKLVFVNKNIILFLRPFPPALYHALHSSASKVDAISLSSDLASKPSAQFRKKLEIFIFLRLLWWIVSQTCSEHVIEALECFRRLRLIRIATRLAKTMITFICWFTDYKLQTC